MLEDIERGSAQVDRLIEHRAQSEKLNSQRYREEAAYRAAERRAEERRRAQLAQEWFSYHVEMGQRALANGRACANRHAAAAAKLARQAGGLSDEARGAVVFLEQRQKTKKKRRQVMPQAIDAS